MASGSPGFESEPPITKNPRRRWRAKWKLLRVYIYNDIQGLYAYTGFGVCPNNVMANQMQQSMEN